MFRIKSKGDYSKTRHFFEKIARGEFFADLDAFGQRGVYLLEQATPVDTGETAHSWDYRIVKRRKDGPILEWFNTNADGNGQTSVAILLQYGHGTGTGGYVQGIDYINPAIKPLFDELIGAVWKEVKSG